jgi:hypothetical protein
MQTCDDDKLNLTGSSQAMAQRTEDAMGQAALRATARWWPEVRRRQQRMEPTTAAVTGCTVTTASSSMANSSTASTRRCSVSIRRCLGASGSDLMKTKATAVVCAPLLFWAVVLVQLRI